MSEYVEVPAVLWGIVLGELLEKGDVKPELRDRLESITKQTKDSVRVRSQVQYSIPLNDTSMIDREEWAMQQLRTQLANALHDAGLVQVDRHKNYFVEHGTITLQGSVEVLRNGS